MDPVPAFCGEEAGDEGRKVRFAVTIVADHHAGQDYFAVAGLEQPRELPGDAVSRLALRSAAHQGDDAVGTEVVAPVLYLEIHAAR